MAITIQLGEIEAEVLLKDIKNVHLSVHPPTGRVRIAAPRRMKLDTIRVFAISKLDWIKRQQRRMREQEREPIRDYVDRESHFVWGKRHLLEVVEDDCPPSIVLKHNRMVLTVRPGTDSPRRHAIVESWYRDQLRAASGPLIRKWERSLKVTVRHFFVRRMRTRWGSCNPRTGTIRVNTDLARKPSACLDYILLHEIMHLIEPSHNGTFVALLDRAMPNWRHNRELLNRLPVRHEDWEY